MQAARITYALTYTFTMAISNDISVIIINDRQYLAVLASVGLGIYALSPEFRVPTIGSLLYVFAMQKGA